MAVLASPGDPVVDLALIAAAGGSTRMGSPKALLELHGEPLVARHARAFAAVARRVIIVLGADADRIAAALPVGVEVVRNPAWATTDMWRSLHLGARAAPAARTALVTPVDVPPPGAWLADLADAEGLLVPCDPRGAAGHPARLDAAALDRLRAGGSGTLRELCGAARRFETTEPWISLDFDTPEAWNAWRSLDLPTRSC